jgi:3'-5' exoribonuclease
MPRRLFLRDCQPGEMIDDVLVVSGKQLAMGSNGKQYIKGFISDRTLQVTARMWNATREIFNSLPDSGFLKVRARIENYQGNLQAVIEQVGAAKEGTFEIGDLLPQTTQDIGQMCRRLTELLGSLQNRHLGALVQAYLDDNDLMTQFCKAPAAMSFHHAYIGGLLEHTLSAIEVADAVCPFYPGLSRDLVIAGLFLHDIAKTWELCYDCAFGYSDGGQLIGHIVKSAMWVEEKAKEAERVLGEPLPRNLIDVIQHIILSHHGVLDHAFGSAKSPATPEAMFIHMIDDMDAKMMIALKACRGEAPAPGAEGNWTEYMKAFGGRLYRPDVAPADAGLPPEDPAVPVALPIPTLTNPLFAAEPRRR